MNNSYIVYVKIINNKVNQSFSYMIDLSLYNTLEYADLVLVKFNNRFQIGFVESKNILEVEVNYEILRVIKVLQTKRLDKYSKEIIKTIEAKTFNLKEDIVNLVINKNEMNSLRLEVIYLEDIFMIQSKIELYLKQNKIPNKNTLSEYFKKDKILYSTIKREHLKLFEYLYEQKMIDIDLIQPKVQNIEVYSEDGITYFNQKDYLKFYNINAYKFNKLRKNNELKIKEIEDIEYQELRNIQENIINLTEYQQGKLEDIQQNIQNTPVLLRGITGSGKTSIFIKLINDILADNNDSQILFLVPEITLAKQVIDKLEENFGDICSIYTGDLTKKQKAYVLKRIRNKKSKIIIGTRSSIFLKFSNLDLVIIDEEHDSSYKQNFYPYYSVHDMLDFWQEKGIKILLASATPSILTYAKSKKGVYHLVEMTKRYNDYSQAQIKFREYDKDNIINSSFIKEIKSNLDKKEKVLIFFNVKGYSRSLECNKCLDIPTCPNCSIPLKYYKNNNVLECGYCDHKVYNYTSCSKCGSHDLKYIGIGIEKVENELNKYFEGKVLRIDSKVAQTKVKVNKILKKFSEEDDNILLGTQIIAKGLNFNNLNKVIILNLDNMLYFNDFSAYESTYQLLEQVSGRSGRQKEDGEVIIYTNHKENFIYKAVLEHNYELFYKEEMINRKLQNSVPFYYIAQIELRNKDEKDCIEEMKKVKDSLDRTDLIITNIMVPYINKIANEYRLKVYIKYKKEDIKSIIKESLAQMECIESNVLIDLEIKSYGY